MSCFESSKSFLRCNSALSFLNGDLTGLFVEDSRGDVGAEKSDSFNSLIGNVSLDELMFCFCGEWTSCQLFVISALQNASMLGRCGVGGTFAFSFLGDWSLGLIGLVGGVIGRSKDWYL